jgi:transcriptional regulator with XRE-family HTH domain
MADQKLTKVIGQKIKKARKESGVSQEQLADKLGLSGNNIISRWENGLGRISADQLAKIAELTHRPISYFFGEVGDDKLKTYKLEQKLKKLKELLEE